MNRTLTIDLDGTLVDSVPDLLGSCNRMMAARGLGAFTAPEVTAMVGDGAAALVRQIMAARGRGVEAGDVETFIADYMAHSAEASVVYPGVEAGLARMTAEGWRLAVCTNKPVAAAREVLEALGLLHWFGAVGGGDSYAVRKPDAGHVLGVIAEAGGVVGGAVMLGDHHNDVAAARAAGVPVIFAGWGYGPVGMADGAPVGWEFGEVPGLAAKLAAGLLGE